jgi:hypothetical protein
MIRRLAGLLFLALLLSSCKSGTQTQSRPPDEPPPQAKQVAENSPEEGYQLYSWDQHGEWHFSLLSGGNKLRAFEEVTADEVAVEGIASIKSRLRGLPRGTPVSWSCHETTGTEFPPRETLAVISTYCAQRGILLTIKH